MKYSIAFSLLLFLFSVQNVYSQTDLSIQVTLIEASKSSDFSVDKKIQSLEKPLKELRVKDEKMQEIVTQYRRYAPAWIAEPASFQWEKPLLIPLDKPQTIFLEITLGDLQDDFYPASIRWFTRVEKEEKDILTIRQHKFNKERCLFLFDMSALEQNPDSFKLLAIELVEPKKR